MPSVVLTAASGAPFPIASGNFWSGVAAPHPIGGILLRASPRNSGFAYVSYSGGCTVSSGGFFLSGVNTTDSMIMSPGDSYYVPKAALGGVSGTLGVFVQSDAAGSGIDRIFYELQ